MSPNTPSSPIPSEESRHYSQPTTAVTERRYSRPLPIAVTFSSLRLPNGVRSGYNTALYFVRVGEPSSKHKFASVPPPRGEQIGAAGSLLVGTLTDISGPHRRYLSYSGLTYFALSGVGCCEHWITAIQHCRPPQSLNKRRPNVLLGSSSLLVASPSVLSTSANKNWIVVYAESRNRGRDAICLVCSYISFVSAGI